MFCSKCGQEQASDSVHFCSQCGIKLSNSEEGPTKRLLIMALYLVVTVCALGGWGSETAGPGYTQARVFISIIAAITFYFLFSNDLTEIFGKLFPRNSKQQEQIEPARQKSALPPARGIPVPSFGSQRVNTAEMVRPPSVTEHTTNFLDKDKY